MKSVEIENIRSFTGALFAGTTFDPFCVTEASFSTLFSVRIDGHVNQEYLGLEESGEAAQETEEVEAAEEKAQEQVVKWADIRPLCYEVVKGESLPVKFKIVLMTPPEKIPAFLEKHGINMSADNVNALFMNIKYEGGKITCTSGTSLKEFTKDRSLEEAWDSNVEKFAARFTLTSADR